LIESRFHALDQKLDSIAADVTEVKVSMATQTSEMKNLNNRFDKLENTLAEKEKSAINTRRFRIENSVGILVALAAIAAAAFAALNYFK